MPKLIKAWLLWWKTSGSCNDQRLLFVNGYHVFTQSFVRLKHFPTCATLMFLVNDGATFHVTIKWRFRHKCLGTIVTLVVSSICVWITVCAKVVFIHETGTTNITWEFKFLSVFLNVQFKIINALKRFVTISFAALNCWNIFSLKCIK